MFRLASQNAGENIYLGLGGQTEKFPNHVSSLLNLYLKFSSVAESQSMMSVP